MILLRCDAGPDIGSGHLMRCLALGQAWQAQGGSAMFLSHCPGDGLRRRIEAAGIRFIPLDRPHPDPSDLFHLQELAAGQAQPPWLVMDGYHFDPAYQQALRAAGHRLLVIDDTAHLPHYHADIVLNQNIHADQLVYRCDPDTVTLLGTHYVLLRPEFLVWQRRQRTIPPIARKILVTLGGSDPNNVTLRVIEALLQMEGEGLEVVIAVGADNPHYPKLQEVVRQAHCPIRLVRDALDMPELMAWADVAVSAGGSTCWELAFMGVPSTILVLAENQRGIAKMLGELGAVIGLDSSAPIPARRIAAALTELMADSACRQRMSLIGPMLVDGQGADRVVAIMRCAGSPLDPEAMHLRPARTDDAVLLWQWANDPLTRLNSFHSEAISWDTHRTWYAEQLASSETRIWIMEWQGISLGQIRYDRVAPDTAGISFSVAPGWRGKGVGTRLLEASYGPAYRELGVQWLQGITFSGNEASIWAFRKAGFDQTVAENIAGHPCLVFKRSCLATQEESHGLH